MSSSQEDRIKELWNQVQSNEGTVNSHQEIAVAAEVLLEDPAIKENRFLKSKLQLILFKAGKNLELNTIISEFESIIAKDSSIGVDGYLCLCEALVHAGRIDDCFQYLDIACSIGDYPEIYVLFSLCERRKKPQPDIKRSIELAKKAIQIDINNGKSWSALAMAYLNASGSENIRQAQKAFRMAISHGESRNADVIMNMGAVDELLLDFRSALEHYEQAMVMTQGWAAAQQALSSLQGRIDYAMTRVASLQKLKPKKKSEMMQFIKGDNQYVVAECTCNAEEPSQILLCFDKFGEIAVFGVSKLIRPYIKFGKTCLLVEAPKFEQLMLNQKTLPYCPLLDFPQANIIGGVNPQKVAPVTISSAVA